MDKYLFYRIVIIVSIVYFVVGAIVGGFTSDMRNLHDSKVPDIVSHVISYITCSVIVLAIIYSSLKGVF